MIASPAGPSGMVAGSGGVKAAAVAAGAASGSAAPGGLIRRRRAEEAVRETLGLLGLGEIDPRAEVRTLALPTRQKIEIARAVSRTPRILLLDEPTASLTGRDVHWLEGLVGRQKGAGVTVVFISHRMQEVRAFCDRLTVLRNGRNVGSFALDEVDDDEQRGNQDGDVEPAEEPDDAARRLQQRGAAGLHEPARPVAGRSPARPSAPRSSPPHSG